MIQNVHELAPGTAVRPVSAVRDYSIGTVLKAEPLHFRNAVYVLVNYPGLGGQNVWSPVSHLVIVDRERRP